MQIIKAPKVHPVVIIGSGASGGMAAWNLTGNGINVLMLDAGERFDRSTFWTHVQPWEARERTARGEHPDAHRKDKHPAHDGLLLLIVLQPEMRDLFLTHQVPKRVLELRLLDEKIMLRLQSRSGHRRLVIEA